MAELSVFGVGIPTADPELRRVGKNNIAVCSVSLAFNRSYKDKNDKWQQEPCFLRAQAWGTRAEKMAEIVKKGNPIYICGHMKQDSWEGENGQKRISYSINIKDFQLCVKNTKKDNSSEKPVNVSEENVDDSSIPF